MQVPALIRTKLQKHQSTRRLLASPKAGADAESWLDAPEAELRKATAWQQNLVEALTTYGDVVAGAFAALAAAHEALQAAGIAEAEGAGPLAQELSSNLRAAHVVACRAKDSAKLPLETTSVALASCLNDVKSADAATGELRRYSSKFEMLADEDHDRRQLGRTTRSSSRTRLQRNRSKLQNAADAASVARSKALDLLRSQDSQRGRVCQLAGQMVMSTLGALRRACGEDDNESSVIMRTQKSGETTPVIDDCGGQFETASSSYYASAASGRIAWAPTTPEPVVACTAGWDTQSCTTHFQGADMGEAGARAGSRRSNAAFPAAGQTVQDAAAIAAAAPRSATPSSSQRGGQPTVHVQQCSRADTIAGAHACSRIRGAHESLEQAACLGPIGVGDVVELQGVQSGAPELNGRRGVVCAADVGGRFAVHVDHGGIAHGLGSAQLRRLSAPPSVANTISDECGNASLGNVSTWSPLAWGGRDALPVGEPMLATQAGQPLHSMLTLPKDRDQATAILQSLKRQQEQQQQHQPAVHAQPPCVAGGHGMLAGHPASDEVESVAHFSSPFDEI